MASKSGSCVPRGGWREARADDRFGRRGLDVMRLTMLAGLALIFSPSPGGAAGPLAAVAPPGSALHARPVSQAARQSVAPPPPRLPPEAPALPPPRAARPPHARP